MSASAELVGLLRLLREHEDVVEADLQRFYGIDYRDRWRFDEHGRRKLTLRRIAVLVRYLPGESALVTTTTRRPHWSLTDHLLDDIRMQLRAESGEKKPKPYPTRLAPEGDKPVSPERRRRLAAARRRAVERRRRIAAGEIT